MALPEQLQQLQRPLQLQLQLQQRLLPCWRRSPLQCAVVWQAQAASCSWAVCCQGQEGAEGLLAQALALAQAQARRQLAPPWAGSLAPQLLCPTAPLPMLQMQPMGRRGRRAAWMQEAAQPCSTQRRR